MAIRQAESIPRRFHGFLDGGMVAEVSDAELLARFTDDRDEPAEIAFAALVRRHGAMVFRVCRQILGDRHIAEDAFQATFLILARRAGSIHQPELLGHWLHGVAFRTAREARMREHRRQRRECAIDGGGVAEPVDRSGRPDLSLVCREEFEALHEEVSRLPERYRVPVVLCDLEGLTYQDAALRVGCPVGTIGVRLRRARERLRARLMRRGLAPMAGLLVTLLEPEAASVFPPPLLVDCTVKAAIEFVASSAASAGLASAPVIALSERILRAMAFSRFKAGMHLALAVGISAAVAWLAIPHHKKTLTVPPAANHQLSDALIPARQTDASERVGLHSPAEAISSGLAPKEALADRALADTPQVQASKVAAKLPDDVFAGTLAADDQSANYLGVAIGKPAPDLEANAQRLARDERARGQILFAKEWMSDDTRSHGGDGLGPVYNETSCVACHGLGAPGGAGPASKNVVLITATSGGCGPTIPLERIHPGFRGSRSAVLHRFGTDPDYASWLRRFYESNRGGQSNAPSTRRDESVEGRIQALKEQTTSERRIQELSSGLRSMNGVSVSLSERNTPPLFGVGQIDEIPSDVLDAVAARQPAAIRGRVSRTKEGRVGRFGSKAQVPTLHEFVRGACANELGLEVPGHSQGLSPLAPTNMAKGLDLTEPECDDLVAYVRSLPAPLVVNLSGPHATRDARAGRRLFAQVNCTSCHIPTLGDVGGIYSDLLLHNMGQSLSDSGSSYGGSNSAPSDGPSPREWRTPPLWGYRDSGPYLHDGRAQNLEEAVALHEGQGKASAHQFFRLAARERAQVEVFLKSLIAPAPDAAPAVAQTSEIASRFEQEELRAAETLVRRTREVASARDEEQFRAAQRRRHAAEAAKRARAQIPLARSLEKMGKITGALEFYQAIAREASGTKEGRMAESRISELNRRKGTP